MKTVSLCIFIVTALFVAGCGGKKNPVGDDLPSIRQEGKTRQEMGPQQPQVVTNTVIVEKKVEVIREESSIDSKLLVITPDPEMSFNEGVQSSYKVRASVLTSGVQISLAATDLPEGATLTQSTKEKDLYTLTWKPAYYIIPTNTNMKTYRIKLTAKVVSAANPDDVEKFKNLVRESTIPLFVFRNQVGPSNLKIQGLPSEVNQGTETPFKVTVRVPGVDEKAPTPPILVVRYDGVTTAAGNNFLESDATRYLIVKETKHLGDFNWEYSFIFDTKNRIVEPQLAKNGSPLPEADGLRARMSFKVYNGTGLSTPETLFQLKIKYNSQARM